MISQTEFNKIPKDNLIVQLREKCKIHLSGKTSELIVRDIAQNKLHGTIFINNNEEMKGNKIVKKTIKINKNFEKCPGCGQKSLIQQPFPESTGLKGSKYCVGCGYLQKPKDTKQKTTSKKESKQ